MSDPNAPDPVDPADVREVRVTGIGHPLADRVGATPDFAWVATETRSRVVRLSPSRVNLLAVAARDGRRPVLISDELSRLTPVFAQVWRLAGGGWVVREADGGLRNGFDGARLDRIEEVWTRPTPTSVDAFAVNHLRPARADVLQLTVMVAMRHPARSSTLLGGPVEQLVAAVHGAPPRAWGPYEPASAPWDRAPLTELIREQMPDEAAVFVTGPGVAGTVSGQRTEHGVEESTHVTITLDEPTAARIAAARTALDAALQRLAETAMPLVGLVLARPGSADLLVPPVLMPAPLPLTLLVGAPAVREFALDPGRMAQRHGGRSVGRPRIPACLFDLGALEPAAWTRLDAILADFDPDRLADALGVGRETLRAAQLDRPAGTDGPDSSAGSGAGSSDAGAATEEPDAQP